MPLCIGVDCDEVLSETLDELLKRSPLKEKWIQKHDITSYSPGLSAGRRTWQHYRDEDAEITAQCPQNDCSEGTGEEDTLEKEREA